MDGRAQGRAERSIGSPCRVNDGGALDDSRQHLSERTRGRLAAALAVMRAMPELGLVLLFLAGSIAVACVVGRYHYIADVVTGALLTMVIWSVVT